MATPFESASLIARLYELRREPTMREARHWFVRSCHPSTADDILQIVGGPNGAHFRMVTSYWDMAASFVLHGAIDEQMFNDANGEHVIVFAKVAPHIAEYRQKTGNASSLASLETLVMKLPNIEPKMAALRERFKSMNN